MSKLLHFIKKYTGRFTQKLSSTRNRNVFVGGVSFVVIRVLSSIMNYFQIGIVVRYLAPEIFGLWAVVGSVCSVFSMFNLGFGSSLMNKLSKLFAENKDAEAKEYFFSILYAIFVIIGIVGVLVLLMKPVIHWDVLLKTDNVSLIRTGALLFVVFSFLTIFSIPFTFSDVVYYSRQESWWVSGFAFLLSFLLLLSSYVLVKMQSSSMMVILSLAVMPLITGICSFTVMLYKNNWKPIAVPISKIKERVFELFPQSIQFVFIQIPSMVLLSVDTMVVGKTAGLSRAGDYFIIKKIVYLFAVIYLASFSALWASYTEAAHKNDLGWIKKMLVISGGLTICAYIIFLAGIYFFGRPFVHLWTGKVVNDMTLYLLLVFWSFLYSWGSCYSIFLNSIGNLKAQAIFLTLGTILLFPLAEILGKRYGIYGVCWSWIIITGLMAVANPIQSYIYIERRG